MQNGACSVVRGERTGGSVSVQAKKLGKKPVFRAPSDDPWSASMQLKVRDRALPQSADNVTILSSSDMLTSVVANPRIERRLDSCT